MSYEHLKSFCVKQWVSLFSLFFPFFYVLLCIYYSAYSCFFFVNLSAFRGPVEDFAGLKCVFLGLYLTLFSTLLQFLWIKQISAASGSIQGSIQKKIHTFSKNHIRAISSESHKRLTVKLKLFLCLGVLVNILTSFYNWFMKYHYINARH